MNGVINKKIQFIFDTKYDIRFKNTDVAEGTYALIRNTGDVYIFNGSGWVLYRQRVLPEIQTPKIQANRYNKAIRLHATSSYALSEYVEFFIGHYGNSFTYNTSISENCSLNAFNSGSVYYSITGSSMWENVSMSLS